MGDTVFDFDIVKVAGTPQDDFWSGNFLEKPQDTEKLEYRGQLFLVVVIKAGENSANLAHQFWTELATAFYNNSAGSVLTALQESAKSASEKVLPQFSFAESGIVAACLWGKILYLVAVGSAAGGLVRAGKFSKIIEGGELPEQATSASGFLEDGDIVILATKYFFEEFENLENFSGKLAQELEEEAASKISGLAKSDKIAASILRIKEAPAPAQADVITFAEPAKREKIPIAREFSLLKQKILQIWVNFGNIIFKFFGLVLKFLPKRNVYLNFSTKRLSRRSFFTLVFFVLVLTLAVSLSAGIWQRQQKFNLQKFEEFFAKAENLYQESVEISSINRLRARELLSEATKNLDQAKKLKFEKKKVADLEERIKQANLQSLKLVKVDNPTLIFDLAVVKTGAVLAEVEKPANLLAFDKVSPTLFFVDPAAKLGQIAAGGESFSGFVNFTTAGSFAYFFKSSDGIYQLDLDSKELKKVIELAQNFGEILDLASFSGNLYLLDAKLGQIWKSQAGSAGFSEFRQFITKPAQVDFSNSTFSIDGLIWVLTGAGTLYQVTPNEVKAVDISGLDRETSAKTILRTTAEAENLYIADVGNSRILVLSKNGLYLAQYTSGTFGAISDFAVDEKVGKLYFSVASKVFQIDLVK